MTMSSFLRLNGHRSDDRKLPAWQLHIIFAALGFFITLLTSLKAYAGEPLVLKSESSLELTPVENGTLIKQNISKIFITSDNAINTNRNFFIIRSDSSIEYNYEEKGTYGHIKISAESLSRQTMKAKKIYSFEAKGTSVSLGHDIITIYKDADLSLAVSDSYFTKTGEFAFSSIGEPSFVSITHGDFWEQRIAAFSPYNQRIPERHKKHAIGIIAYSLPNKLLAEALLLADDPDMASSLASPVDEHQTLLWIDLRSGHPPDTRDKNGNVGFTEVAMRLRFHGSRIDLSIPVTKENIDYKKLSLPKGLKLIPLD